MTRANQSTLPDWQRAGAVPSASAVLRSTPDDFRVTELLDIEFSGLGEHDWLYVEKREANTAWVGRMLARFAGVQSRDVGYAGLKDRHALTRQWFSVRRARDARHNWQHLDLPGVTIIEERRHSRKLRRGAHRGNRFELLLRELRGDPEAALQRIAADGVPNYFGEQRFGLAGGNIGLAMALFEGRRLKREQRGIALSSARSMIFNDVLDQRVRSDTWNRLQDGDIAILDGSNSHFTVDKVDDELVARCAAFDVHPSGPLWGRRRPGSTVAPGEESLARRHALLAEGLEQQAEAARRALRLPVIALNWELPGDAELRIAFDLSAGAYATAVLRECIDYRDATRSGMNTADS